MESPGVFCLLNETRDLGWPIDWRAPDASLLWRYNLHYFDDLIACDADRRRSLHHQLVAQWISQNPQGARPGWEPYPLSLRIVNWIKWNAAGNDFSAAIVASLAAQVRWLAARLEWHLLGNHLFANAKALIFAGCFFSGPDANHWLRAGLRIVARELNEQVLPDGGNFELSPMYHAIFLADLLDLVNLSKSHPGRLPADVVTAMADRAARMLEWLGTMVHPDGEIALFNDSAIGVAPNLKALRDYAHRLSVPIPAEMAAETRSSCKLDLLTSSGYARLACADAVAFCDVAKVGPDYLPGHAHADSLSFELSVGERRVIVNGGTSRYGVDDIRLRERGTASHSTVEVDGTDSSEVWGGFRVARRARPFAVSHDVQADRIALCASHDGYRRLSRDIVHRRQWTMTPAALRIEDIVTGSWAQATARYILDASIEVEALSPGRWLLRTDVPGTRPVEVRVNGGHGRLEPAWHSLEFGKRLATRAIAVDLTPNTPASVTIAWADDANPVLH